MGQTPSNPFDVSEAHFSRFLHQETVLLLSKEEANRLVGRLLKEAGLGPDARLGFGLQQDLVHELSGLHPFFLHLACYVLFEHCIQPDGTFREPAEEEVHSAFLAEATPYFERCWDSLSREERILLRRMATGEAKVDDSVADRLRNRGFIVPDSQAKSGWRLFSAPFEGWIQDKWVRGHLNPYSYGPMVTDPKMFFGREEELRTLYTRLRTMQSTSVVGLRRIGKSSLLYHLVQSLGSELGRHYLPVYVDLHDARCRTVGQFVVMVLEAMKVKAQAAWGIAMPIPDISALVTDKKMNMADFSRIVDELYDQGVRLVLCLDEFEELLEQDDEFGDDFLEALRALGSQGKLAMVTASRQPLANLARYHGLTSPFPNIFSSIELGLLSAEAAQALRREPFGWQGIELSQEDEDLLEELAGRHPFYLQMACYHLYEVYDKPSAERAELVREHFRQDARSHFGQMWSHLGEEERDALRAVVRQRGAERAGRLKKLLQLIWRVVSLQHLSQAAQADVLEELSRLGVVERTDAGWRFFSEAFATWVQTGDVTPVRGDDRNA